MAIRSKTAIAAGLLAISCVNAPGQIPNKPTIDGEWKGCLEIEASRLDDHKSDAATIAKGIQSACEIELRASVAAATVGMSPDAARDLERNMRAMSSNDAIKAVVKERTQKGIWRE